MAEADIARDFPELKYSLSSDPDFNYNCLAFVLGDVHNWWEPPGMFGHYWPPGFPGDTSVETAVAIIKLHGFVVESDIAMTPLTDSIAIYAIGKEWTHFAKFSNGSWCSKLGEGNDVLHTGLEGLEGQLYGRVVKILSRKLRNLPKS